MDGNGIVQVRKKRTREQDISRKAVIHKNKTRKRRKKRRSRRYAILFGILAATVSIAVLLHLKERIGKNENKAQASYSGLIRPISLVEQLGDSAPALAENSLRLARQEELTETYKGLSVTYWFGSKTERLDGMDILQWLKPDNSGDLVVDRQKAEAYVQELSKKYNTAYCPKELKTAYGPTVTLTKGHYGWMIDKKAETDALIEIIQSGESQEREPIYLQTAVSHDGPDFGDTYVEINLTAQHLYFYKNGKLLVESDFVSGDENKGYSTPAGAYELTYKQRNATLKGKNYKTPVTYWMPFNGNIGMHDGYWRTRFGGTIYKKNGSHGCINLPPEAAKTIFEHIEAKTPVLCYHLEHTETQETTVYSLGTKPNAADSAPKTETVKPSKPAETVAKTVPEPPAETVPESSTEISPGPDGPSETVPVIPPAASGEDTTLEQVSEPEVPLGPGNNNAMNQPEPTGEEYAN